MSSSSGTGCSASCSTVRSRSMSSEPPRYGTDSISPAPRRAVTSRLGRGTASRAAISRARRSVSGSGVTPESETEVSVPCSPVVAGAPLPVLFDPASERSRGSPPGTTLPPPLAETSSSVGSSVSSFGLRRSGRSLFGGPLPRRRCAPGRRTGESASTSLQPGTAAAGSRMKWFSQISRSTCSGADSTVSSRKIRPERATTIAS